MDLQFDGLIVESHNDPEHAWSDASQQVTPDVLSLIINNLVIRETSQTTENLTELRKQIDEIDMTLIETLAKRMRISREIGTYKKEHEMPILQTNRYDEIINKRAQEGVELGMGNDFMKIVFEYLTMKQKLFQRIFYKKTFNTNEKEHLLLSTNVPFLINLFHLNLLVIKLILFVSIRRVSI